MRQIAALLALSLALLLTTNALGHGDCHNAPCVDCAGVAETDLGLALGAPVPASAGVFRHVAGSHFHCNVQTQWWADCFALDVNGGTNEEGTPVIAVEAGTVAVVQYDVGGYGNNVRIDHNIEGTAFRSLYAHMDEALMVEVGQRVERGQIVGFISNSNGGWGAMAVHLHFSLQDGASPAVTDDLDGNDIRNAECNDINPLNTSSKYIWLEDFIGTNSAWVPGVFDLRQTGYAAISAAGTTAHYDRFLPYDAAAGPCRVSFAAKRLGASGADGSVTLLLECFDADQETLLGTRQIAQIDDTWDGWLVASEATAELPAGTDYVRPMLQTSVDFNGKVVFDWMKVEDRSTELPDTYLDWRPHPRGGEMKMWWRVEADPSFDHYQAFRSTERTGDYAAVGAAEPALGTPWASYEITDETAWRGSSYYYELRAYTADDSLRLGPLGPVDLWVEREVPGFGRAKIVTDMLDVPQWCDYPDASFDDDTDTYGIVDYNPSPVGVYLVPLTGNPSVRSIETYFGTTLNTWRAAVGEYPSGRVRWAGPIDNLPGEWSTLTGPVAVRVRWIYLTFQRNDGDQYFHNAELRFAP